MKYRWGFIEGGVFTECKPVVEDDTSLDFSQQSGEVFYRAKLNGSLLFRFEFDDILAKGYNYEHIVVLQYFDTNADDWAECWRGRFALTDCEIDYDTNTISVQPETQDRYTKILDHLEDEYNLIKIKPTQKPVKMQIRPVVQLYSIGSSKVTNITTNGFYEQDVNNPIPDMLSSFFIYNATTPHNCYFALPHADGDAHVCMPKGVVTLWLQDSNNEDVFFFAECGLDNTQYNNTVVHNAQIYQYDALTGTKTIISTIDAAFYFDGDFTTYIFDDGANTYAIKYNNADNGADEPSWYQIPAGYTFVKARANQYVSRILLNTDADSVTWNGVTVSTVDLDQATDIAPIANYNKIAPIDITSFVAEAEFTDIVTEYGIADNDGYFKKYNGGDYYYRPINISEWCLHSMWARPVANGLDDYNKEVEIRDCYTLPSVIYRLMKKADVSLNFIDNASKSAFLFGSDNHITENAFYLLLTPRSNIISSYYDTPALNAPITFQNVLSMLKNLYKVYWFIDENNYLRFEHISYFDNGYSYTEGEPGLLVDLESHLHTNTKENKCFGQNKVKYEKAEMPEQYKFSFDDSQTIPFDGYPIKCTEAYVSKGQFDEKAISKFDTDVDMILATPSEFSKEGFVLLACPYENGTRKYVLGIKNKFKIVDEDGNAYRYSLQNYDCAIAYIQKYWWRYDLPCENIIINNEADTAKSTGKYKLQSVEFADTVLAEILADVDNCNKVIRTQQGDGKIKTLSINLNSLAAKADLLFNFVGRWYYLRGTALGASIIINVDNEPITIEVENNKWRLKYAEPMTALDFNGADIVSVDFADCDKLENLTSCDDMFKNCAELLSVDFGGKKLAAVTSATDMFSGCAQLTTLVCPQTSTWKPDITFADCPDLTIDSVYSLIGFLYDYDSGVHTINFNSTMWNAVDADTQNDIIAKAGAKGWTIGTAVAYYISGQSAASTVYATINGSAVEIPVSGGAFNYAYYAPITSISFAADADVTDIDFSLSDGLAGVTSLNDAFKNCAGLTSVDFTNCDLSNVATAADCFAGCSALYTLEIPSGTWQPDLDLSASVMPKTEMLNVVDGLYTYTGGVHNVTFNSTMWDAMSAADQQAVSDAAQLKYWTTNSVAVVYVVSGTSSAASETFNIQFILDGQLTPETAETITVAVDGNGDWEFSYIGKKIYSLNNFARNITTITSVDFSQAEADEVIECGDYTKGAFQGCTNLLTADFSNCTFAKCGIIYKMFEGCTSLTQINFNAATFQSLYHARAAFYNCSSLATITWSNNLNLSNLQYQSSDEGSSVTRGMFQNCALLSQASISQFVNGQTFAKLTEARSMFRGCKALTTIDLSVATFNELTTTALMFYNCTELTSVDISGSTFSNLTETCSYHGGMFQLCAKLTTIIWSNNLNLIKLEQISVNDNSMYQGCTKLNNVDWSSQTLPALTRARAWFYGCAAMTNISLPLVTFANINGQVQNMFRGCTHLVSVDLSIADFSSVSNSQNMFMSCNALTTIDVPQNSTAILPTSTAADAPMNLSASPLTYTSMLKVANWLVDLTGYTAHTCTFKSSAWNALSTAEQNNIDSILSGKNWTRAIA